MQSPMYTPDESATALGAFFCLLWLVILIGWLVGKSHAIAETVAWFRRKAVPAKIFIVCAFCAVLTYGSIKGGGNAPQGLPRPPLLLQVLELPPEPATAPVSVWTNGVALRAESTNAVEITAFRTIGGSELGDWIETSAPFFAIGTNPVNRCFVSASGSVSFETHRRPQIGRPLPDESDFGRGRPPGGPLDGDDAAARLAVGPYHVYPALCPLRTPLGMVPEANWGGASRPGEPLRSRFWHDSLPGGGRVLTWENALVDRLPGRRVTLQVEMRPTGNSVFRYSFQDELDPPPTNFVMGAQMGTNGVNALSILGTNTLAATVWNVDGAPVTNGVTIADLLCTNGVLRTPSAFEIRWKNTTGLDPEADTDDDGLTDWAETFLWGTDPNHADTDGDGTADNVELANHVSPVDYDIDQDGLVDGIDPHPAVYDGNGYGTSDLWVQCSFTNAAEILAEGYESYVSRTCTAPMLRGALPSGTSIHPELDFFCLEAVVSELPVAGRALIVAGLNRVVVNVPGTYRFFLERGTSHVLRTDAPWLVTFRCDDPWPEIVQPQTGKDGLVTWPASGIHVAPSTHHYYSTGEECKFWADCLDCFDGNASSWDWSSACPDLAFDTPHASSCTVQWTGQNCSWGTASFVVSCTANGQTLSTNIWVTFGSHTTPQPHLSASFPAAFFVNDDDDDGNGVVDWEDQTALNDDDIVPFTVAFSADDSMTGELTIETLGSASGFRAWTDSSKSSSVELPATFSIDTPTSTATWTIYFEAQTPSGSVGGAHLRATFDRSDGGAYAIADCLSTAVEVGDVIVPTAPSSGLAVLAGTNVAMRVVVSPVNAASLVETDWETAKRKSDGSYHEWVRVETGASGTQFSCPFPTGGVYKVHAFAHTSFSQRESVYLRNGKGPLDYPDIEPENHIGVATTQTQLALREFAVGQLGNTAFAKAAFLPSLNGFSAVKATKWKCNAFAAYCAISVGQSVPVQRGNPPFSSYPPLANDWANGESIAGWTFLGTGIDPEPGWICGHPSPNPHGHVGIVDYDGYCVAAGKYEVNRKFEDFLDGTSGYSKHGTSP